jgi:lysozyme
MAFNLGVDGLMTFKNTLQAIQERRFGFAASGMMASKWAKQVGDRASRLSKMMREG